MWYGTKFGFTIDKKFLGCLTILLSRWDLKTIVPAITDGSLELELNYPFVENRRSIPRLFTIVSSGA